MLFYSVYSFHTFIFLLFVFLFVCCLLMFISYIISYSNYYTDKFFGFECGFDPASDTRSTFKVKFYLVSILFILFDLELVLLLPWGLTLSTISLFSYFVVYLFILFIVFGFVYEWRKNCINFDV